MPGARHSFQAIVFLFISSAVLGCTNSDLKITNSPAEPISGPILTLQTPIFAERTETPEPSFEFLPTLTPFHSRTPTMFPTLTSQEAMDVVANLWKTNGGCRLPCWWGQVIPGETKWEEAEAFLKLFASEIHLSEKVGDVFLYGADFQVPENIRYFELLEVPIDVKDGIVDQIFIGQRYPFSNIMVDLGKPAEIWIHAVGLNTISPEGRYALALYWNDQGVLALYDGSAEKTNPIMICLDRLETEEPALWLWDPAFPRSFNSLLQGVEGGSREFTLLERATNFDIDSFYEEFQEHGSRFCIGMPDPDSP